MLVYTDPRSCGGDDMPLGISPHALGLFDDNKDMLSLFAIYHLSLG
jgi:hypothetical protein